MGKLKKILRKIDQAMNPANLFNKHKERDNSSMNTSAAPPQTEAEKQRIAQE